MRIKKDVVIVGGGPAGMAAAISLAQRGIKDIILLEKEDRLGGVLSQCIHDGFGLVYHHKNYTGPEYAALYEQKMKVGGIQYLTEATVLSIQAATPTSQPIEPTVQPIEPTLQPIEPTVQSSKPTVQPNEPATRENNITSKPTLQAVDQYTSLVTVQTANGTVEYEASAVIVAAGCRERGRGQIGIPGSRPAGLYTAGTAQALMNLQNLMPGHKTIIVGSGDIGLIMARRITLEGGEVLCVVEKEDVPGGLRRNIIQCLEDYNIPLLTNAIVSNIYGKERVTGVDISRLDLDGSIIKESIEHYECDALILSVGLIPEDEMVQDQHQGIFLCGNALYVHDLVDDVTLEGDIVAGQVEGFLIKLAAGKIPDETRFAYPGIKTMRKKRVGILAKKKENARKKAERGEKTITCIMCPNGCEITYDLNGGMCNKGAEYVKNEILSPRRTLTSSVKVVGGTIPLVSVRTTDSIPRESLLTAMGLISQLVVEAPVAPGQVIFKDFMGEGVELVTTKAVEKI